MKLETFSTGFNIPRAAHGCDDVSREQQARRDRFVAALPQCDLACGEKARQITYLYEPETREVLSSVQVCGDCAMRFAAHIKGVLLNRSAARTEALEHECVEAA